MAQNKLNFGLREKQDPSTLPHSNVAVRFPDRKSNAGRPAAFIQTQINEWILTDGWKLASADDVTASDESIFLPEFDATGWIPATVPGTVLTSLVDQGIYPDPYFGLNNLSIPDSLCRKDWWYRISFPMPESPAGRKIWLLLNGINYRADIWINGKKAGSMAGAFKRGLFDVTRMVLGDRENILAVHIFPPSNPGIPQEESALAGPGPNGGQLCLDGPTFISSEGWDWVPGIRDRNIGIWQDVRIIYTGAIRLTDTQVITDLPLPDTSVADITVSVNVENTISRELATVITGKIGNAVFSKEITLQAKESQKVVFTAGDFKGLQMINPKLWWPNGYGQPNLYNLELMVETNAGISDVTQVEFGIREFTYELSASDMNGKAIRVAFDPLKAREYGKPLFDNTVRIDAGDGVNLPAIRKETDLSLLTVLQDTIMAPYLVITVNGKRIFCRGGNWGMDDAMKHTSREHLEPYFRLHREAGFNMVRNWTGENTEEIFYDLCDEYGLLVWNDFWLSTEGYNLEANDNKIFLDNALDVIRRFRNHPSIAIWCPRNEGYAPKGIESPLAEMIALEDGTRYYQPNSRYMNLRPSGPWHYFINPVAYFTDLAKGFNTEMGTPSIPTAESMLKMMPRQDVWPISDTWYYHDLHNGQTEYMDAINRKYGSSSGLENFCKKAQLVNYDSHRAMFESWNSNMWQNTSGLLLWMTHPAWPSTVWQVYSWDYETNGSYFGSQKACEPVHIQLNEDDNKVVIVNASLTSYPGAKASITWYDLSGKILQTKQAFIDVNANRLTTCFIADVPARLPQIYLVRMLLKDKKGSVLSVNDYWKSVANNFQQFNQAAAVKLQIKKMKKVNEGKTYTYLFTVSNPSKSIAISVKLNAISSLTHEIILPSYFSDGYFNLLPGESRQIRADLPARYDENFEIRAEAYNSITEHP